MYKIEKTLDTFSVAHRVYNQHTNGIFEPKCRNVHGHEYKVKIEFSSNALIDDMVIDFNYLKPLKDFIKYWFDHRFTISINDIELLNELNLINNNSKMMLIGLYNVYENVVSLSPQSLKQILEKEKLVKIASDKIILNSLTIVPTNSTSECLAKLIYELANIVLEEQIKKFSIYISKVTVYETPTSSAMYIVN